VYGTGHSDPPSGAVVLGSSFGGLDALKTVLPALPAFFPLPVIVVHHRPAGPPDSLASVLGAWSAMPVDAMGDGYQLRPGRIAVAPTTGFPAISPAGVIDPSPSRLQPIDAAFTAVAARFGSAAIGVVLTGRLADGAQGVRAIKHAGGFVLAQDPDGAAASDMPVAALATGCVDHRVPLQLIASTLVAVAMAPGAAALLRVAAPPWAAPIAG
jgi:two-component system chemotaxis response regulator CheB